MAMPPVLCVPAVIVRREPAVNDGAPKVRPFAEIAAALKLEAARHRDAIAYAEQNGAVIGLSPISTALAARDMREQADLLGDGYLVLDGLAAVAWLGRFVRWVLAMK
jgi:hypothetical protein